MAKFYLVATPIGNLEDISLRALRILKEVNVVLTEKTLITRRLFERYKINTPLRVLHEHSSLEIFDAIVETLKEGRDVALVSEAGTPGIADPGGKLVEYIFSKLEDRVEIIPIPGSSALTTLASISGFNMNRFLFLGFLPKKKGRRKFLKLIEESIFSVIVYESVYRIEKFLQELQELDITEIVVGRELTKKFETIYRGTPEDVLDQLSKGTKKGEFVVAIKK